MPPSPTPQGVLNPDIPVEAVCAASALLPLGSHARPLFIAGANFCSYASFQPAESKTEGEADAGKCSLKSDLQQRKEKQLPALCSALTPHSLHPESSTGRCAMAKYLLEAAKPQ